MMGTKRGKPVKPVKSVKIGGTTLHISNRTLTDCTEYRLPDFPVFLSSPVFRLYRFHRFGPFLITIQSTPAKMSADAIVILS